MFISVLCLALLACLHSAVGAPVRFAKIYEPSEMPSKCWTQKQWLQLRGHYDGHSATAFDPCTSVVHWTRRRDDRPAAVDHRATDETVSMMSCYGKAVREDIDGDGDIDISTYKFLVFLLIIPIAMSYWSIRDSILLVNRKI